MRTKMIFDTLPVKKVDLKKELQKQFKGIFISEIDKTSLENKKQLERMRKDNEQKAKG